MVGVLAAGDAAEIDLVEAGPDRVGRHARHQPRIIVEIVDLELVERLGAESGDRDRDVLKVFPAPLGRHEDGLVVLVLDSLGRGFRLVGRIGLREGDCGTAQKRRRQ